MAWAKRYGYSNKGNQTFTNNMFENNSNKYHNKKSTYEGVDFDSMVELNDYKKLLSFVSQGLIKSVKPHPDGIQLIDPQFIEISEKNIKGVYRKKERALFNGTVFNPDFEVVLPNDAIIYVDSKSYATISDAYKIKVKLLYQKYGKLCITAFPEYMNNFEIVLKAVSNGCFLQYWNKLSIKKYIQELISGKFEMV